MSSNIHPRSKLHESHKAEEGFTLIELSIVLVIIGLIVGGVLVGQDLIRAAEVRATISQIEKYNTAVNTFRGKYNSLPGDLPSATATAFGFAARGTAPGMGDGNGVVEGSASGAALGYNQSGETLSFWVDLTVGNTASPLNINLIDGSFTSYTSPSVSAPSISSTTAANYFPAAKLGRSNYIYVYSSNGINYYGIGNVTTTTGALSNSPSMTVNQAYQMDKKVDDGFPAAGNVTATAGTATTENATPPVVNAAVSDSATSCYNTSGGATPGQYSNSYNNGNSATCSLSFRFQ